MMFRLSKSQRPRRWTLPAAFVVSLAIGALVTGACSGEATTPDCPPLDLYDVRDADARNDPAVKSQRAAAEAKGCMTPLGAGGAGD
jgi:hypothetical protein